MFELSKRVNGQKVHLRNYNPVIPWIMKVYNTSWPLLLCYCVCTCNTPVFVPKVEAGKRVDVQNSNLASKELSVMHTCMFPLDWFSYKVLEVVIHRASFGLT